MASLILFMLLTDIGVVDGGLILDGCYTTAVCFEEENKSILSARTVRGTDIGLEDRNEAPIPSRSFYLTLLTKQTRSRSPFHASASTSR